MDNASPAMQMLVNTWESKVPLRISLDRRDVTCPDEPLPMLVMHRRHGFLQFLASSAFQQFERALWSRNEYFPYFDYNSLPLPWQVPLGVLYDLLANGENPWNLTIHFGSSMPNVLLPWTPHDSEKSFDMRPLEVSIFSSLKEAAFVCRGTDGSEKVLLMGKARRESLWKSILDVDWTSYYNWIEPDDWNLQKRKLKDKPPRIPVRIYSRMGGSVSVWKDDVKSTSRPIEIEEDGNGPTLGEALGKIFPNLDFQEEMDPAASGGLMGDELIRSSELSDNEGDGDGDNGSSDQATFSGKARAIICGVEPPMCTPLAWLHYNMHAPDFFLYIVVITSKEKRLQRKTSSECKA